MIYWDTSAIVPLYVQESTSRKWEEVLAQSETSAKSSTLAVTEFHYALRQKVFRNTIATGDARLADAAEAIDLSVVFHQ